MRSQATPKFWKYYDALPDSIRQIAQKVYQIWKMNPKHPSLHFKRVDDKEPIYSIRISDDYRALGFLEGDTIIWYWIGSHNNYEHLLK